MSNADDNNKQDDIDKECQPMTEQRRLLQETIKSNPSLAKALTPSELDFVRHILNHGTEHEVSLLAQNLARQSHVFDMNHSNNSRNDSSSTPTTDVNTTSVVPTNNEESLTTKALGSTRRQSYIESRINAQRRRSSLQLWKQAGLTVVASNRIKTPVTDNITSTDTTTTTVPLNDGIVGSGTTRGNSGGLRSSMISHRSSVASSASMESICELAHKEQQQQQQDDDDDDYYNEYDDIIDEEELEVELGRLQFQQLQQQSNLGVNDLDEENDGDDDEKKSSEKETDDDHQGIRRGTTTRRCTTRPDMIKSASINMYRGEGFEVGNPDAFDMYSPENHYEEHYDPWMFTDIDEQGHKRDIVVRILGTSHDDPSAQPHVLSPILMQSLQPHLPISKRGESFWLKYSLVRDGASSIAFLQRLRGSTHTLMAMETVDGEVFGAFCSQPWTIQPRYFGTGESFLWRMKHSRILENGEQYHTGTLQEQAQHEAEIEVFPAVVDHQPPEQRLYQLCQQDKIAVGGGVCSTPQDFGKGDVAEMYQPEDIGFALVFDEGNLMYASSSACLTFQSPPLSKHHVDGSKFELVNLEVWALTPCLSIEEAQIMEHKRLFLKRQASV